MRYAVLNENTLGYIHDEHPQTFCVLHGSVIRGGHDWKSGPVHISPLDTVRDATLEDFDVYRVAPPPELTKPA